ncbi:cupin domain-containing protein [Mycobacterium noviomagense]|uniref:JmjC domain-containing protein n=1 Tax=Mycobacterium noviomagense TaxID=459858 RepID=A0A7I7PBE9_9MYCO|nr:cupin domain-containing protein [Mycobacterium noviomagense]BBY05930.1 hypothetical protein MNVI_12480 [Mycobacterium noviomagense]
MQTFLDEIWGSTYYHVKRGRADYFDRLLPGASAVDELLEHVRLDPSAVRLVRHGEDKDPDTYRRADGSLDLARVRSGLADGYTIILNAIEQYVRTIGTLSHAIEVELNFPTRVNGYVTPPESTGFVPHYDPHDVLVLQIQGSKVWHLSDQPVVPPHEIHCRKEVDSAALTSRTDLRLEAGDVLYLPRGKIHGAETTSAPSVHLTVGLHAPTALTLLTHMLHALSLRDDRIHTRLPPRHLDDADVRASLADVVREAARIVEDPSALADGLGAMEDVLARRGRCPPVGQMSNAVGIDGQTRVVKYQPLYSRVISIPGGVALQFAQLLIRTGSDHEAALLFVSKNTEPFRVGDLPGLTAAQQTELARMLITTGFLVRLPGD